jgi:putative FmdB family regulatory protein
MPTYTYECNACSERFEAVQRISDDPLTECTLCDTKDIKRVIVASARPVLKGEGWTGSSLTKR